MATGTDFAALDALYPLPPEELFRQWVLTRDAAVVPSEWGSRTFKGWHLSAHPDAHVCDLLASDGALIGWVIEPIAYLSGSGGSVPTSSLTLAVSEQSTPAEIERALYGRDEHGRSNGDGLHGSWVAIVFGEDDNTPFSRVYLSPRHSVVYSPTHRIVATTHNLVPGLRRNESLSRAVDPLATNYHYPFGLTAFQGLRRLLPNHYLDLDTFEAVRHWPLDTWEFVADGREEAAAIVEHSRQLLGVLSETYSTFRVFLSAGRDSRAVLALLRPLIEDGRADVTLSTSVGRDLESRIDGQIARRLADIAGLPHQTHYQRKKHKVDPAAVRRAFVRVGEARGGGRLAAPQKRQSPPAESFCALGGIGGEISRGFYWPGHRPSAAEVTAEFLVKRTTGPANRPVSTVAPEVVDAAEVWLNRLPACIRASAPDTLDLAYIEQRLGTWEAPQRYLFPSRKDSQSCSTAPMATTFNIETMLRLPEDYRAAGVLQRDMVAYGWPELLEFPFNEPVGLLRVERKLRYIGYRFRRGIRKLKALTEKER